MSHFFKSVGSGFVVFLIFFGAPVFVYSLFQKFLGMAPPAQATETAIYQLASLKAVEAFILVMIFLLVIERRRGKEKKYAFLIASLLFVQGGLVTEIWYHLTLNAPKLYTAAGICSSFISYTLSAWFLSKMYKSVPNMIIP